MSQPLASQPLAAFGVPAFDDGCPGLPFLAVGLDARPGGGWRVGDGLYALPMRSGKAADVGYCPRPLRQQERKVGVPVFVTTNLPKAQVPALKRASQGRTVGEILNSYKRAAQHLTSHYPFIHIIKRDLWLKNQDLPRRKIVASFPSRQKHTITDNILDHALISIQSPT